MIDLILSASSRASNSRHRVILALGAHHGFNWSVEGGLEVLIGAGKGLSGHLRRFDFIFQAVVDPE